MILNQLNSNCSPNGSNTPSRAQSIQASYDAGRTGFTLGGSGRDDRVVVPDALANPTLELRDGNGELLFSNDDWQDNAAQAAIISRAGLAPSNTLESGIAATLSPGQYTAILAGLNNVTGVGLVEVYDLGTP
jgi:hypothetical protein